MTDNRHDEADVRSSNPKHPTLVGYKMGMLWDLVKFERSRLNDAQNALATHQRNMRAFRQRWGRNPPHQESQWLEFWTGFVSMEDELSDTQDNLRHVKETLLDLAEQGREIVDKNGVSMNGGDVLKEIETLLERAYALASMVESEEA